MSASDTRKEGARTRTVRKTDRIHAGVLAELARRELATEMWRPDTRVRADRERASPAALGLFHCSPLKNRIRASPHTEDERSDGAVSERRSSKGSCRGGASVRVCRSRTFAAGHQAPSARWFPRSASRSRYGGR